MDRRQLPIFELESAITRAAVPGCRLVVRAPTGSGKSTQIPQMLRDGPLAGAGEIVVLQPRRLAARMLAARVARERGGVLGGEVGYQVRLEGAVGPTTRIRYVTEGILLRQMLSDPTLPRIAAVVFDEFHERHLYGDITLARALDLQASIRPDLRILVMSATLDTALLETYLRPCVVLESEGRTFPVDIEYAERPPSDREPVWELAADAFDRLIAGGAEGDVLIFMPGAYEIGRTIGALRDRGAARGFALMPLHGELPVEAQDEAVAPGPGRKVVVATNVAETSITIEGVRNVIDGGLARIPKFDPHRGINTLLIERISRAAADQRAGRAGRTAPGRCVRLWTARDHHARAAAETPEVKRLDLAEVALALKASGVNDLAAFRWLEPPAPRSLERAETLLRDLGALDEAGAITPLGRRMLAFPVHPRYARMFIAAEQFQCVDAVALIAALTQGRGLLQRGAESDARGRRDDILGDHVPSDFFLHMRAFRYAERSNFSPDACRRLGIHAQSARQAGQLFETFRRLAKAEGLTTGAGAADDEAVQKCVLAGFSDQVARRLDDGTLRCEMVHGRRGDLARESAVRHAKLIVAADVREIEGRELNVILGLATEVKAEWLAELFPGDVKQVTAAVWDREARRVTGERQTTFRDLVIESKAVERPPEAEAAAMLADLVLKGDVALGRWDDEVEQWIRRVNFVSDHCPDLGVPLIDDEARRVMVGQICAGCYSARELKERPVLPVVKSWLSAAQGAQVERAAPARLPLPGGKPARVEYFPDRPPKISKRIQDLYDLKASPAVALGRVPVVVEILGPNYRPVQTTQDLAGFWRDHYPRIKQELKRKYPKHEWR